MRHGTCYRYDQGCHCAECAAAKTAHGREMRARRRERQAPSYQRELAAARALKETYRGTCRACGKPTTGCNGPGSAPELCQACYLISIRAPHGTRSAYNAGCRCAACTAANRDSQRAYRASKREGGGGSPTPRPPTSNAS